jgi:hypothetical protein
MELSNLNRLAEDGIRLQRQQLEILIRVGHRRDDRDANLKMHLADLPKQLDAAHPGEHDVEKQAVRPPTEQFLKSIGCCFAGGDVVSFDPQKFTQQLAYIPISLDHQYSQGH